MITSKHFTEKEFQKCTPSCSLQDMDQGFINQLDELRKEAGIPLVLSSAYRSPAWEKSKGRSGDGDHPQKKGVDIRCNTSANRYKILKAAYKLGIRRIGIAKTYIHIGSGDNLPDDVAWMY
ncbi:peptidase M15-like protein [Dysgonomonas alginatilytica]|uniref:Peptidase M15-like protein n=1 Tax=Dysgonomonas alginatilytica TaxID=1605892 RepID=A0A2V3PJ80_9BACT|nr:D-Ala-D-Ala carboxypeptidase family metallohydrolase [Dysgonomonas alginatilytica]PXV60170.1 peptidase M15-like protein [Dysgonomonas alginatilytica]